MTTEPYRVKLTVYRADTGDMVVSTLVGELLDGIDVHGALYAAAKKGGSCYSYAWNEVRRAERACGTRLFEGAKGSGSHLTAAGSMLLAHYRALADAVNEQIATWPEPHPLSDEIAADETASGEATP